MLLYQLEKLGEEIAKDCPTFVISQFMSSVRPNIAQQLIVKASKWVLLNRVTK